MNYKEILNNMRNNPQVTGNQTVQNVFKCLDNKDHNALVELYKNTCQTMGQQPNPMLIK